MNTEEKELNTMAENYHPVACWAIQEIARLRAIVDKLPKTKDGVSVVPGNNVLYQVCDVTVYPNETDRKRGVTTKQVVSFHNQLFTCSIVESYSTSEAAEAEKANQ